MRIMLKTEEDIKEFQRLADEVDFDVYVRSPKYWCWFKSTLALQYKKFIIDTPIEVELNNHSSNEHKELMGFIEKNITTETKILSNKERIIEKIKDMEPCVTIGEEEFLNKSIVLSLLEKEI